jgi:hypothetical protein
VFAGRHRYRSPEREPSNGSRDSLVPGVLELGCRKPTGYRTPMAGAVRVTRELGHTAAFLLADPKASGSTVLVGMASAALAWVLATGYVASLFIGTGRTPYDHAAASCVVRSPAVKRPARPGRGTFSGDPGQNAQVSTRCEALKLHQAGTSAATLSDRIMRPSEPAKGPRSQWHRSAATALAADRRSRSG